VHVSRHPFSTRNSAEYRQRYQAVRQQRLPPAFDRAASASSSTTSACAAPGLDYHEYAPLKRHADLASCLESLGQPRLFAFTTKGSRPFHDASLPKGDAFLFGPESRGLPPEVLDALPDGEQRLRLPMREGCRSLNLSNTVAVAVYEAWRQLGLQVKPKERACVGAGLARDAGTSVCQ
jgi:tRNA (cytidine(34)-2'-O)-methyltransferase